MEPTAPRGPTSRDTPNLAVLLLLAGLLGLVPAGDGAHAQTPPALADGGEARIHPRVGLLAGRFDVHGGPRLDVVGARAGLGFGEMAQLMAFYWRELDTDEPELLDGRGWGAEAQLNLGSGFGVIPFVTVGAGRVKLPDLEDQTAAILGAGLLVPLGPIYLAVSAQDYVLGVGGLPGAEDAETSHNWFFSARADVRFGRARTRPAAVAAQPLPQPLPQPVAQPGAQPTRREAVFPVDTVGAVRNYQSDRSIQVPIPLEGSITLRYGPEPARVPGAVAGVAGVEGVVGVEPGDPAVREIIEGTVAALLPRLDARDAQRHRELRAELNTALAAAQQDLVRALVWQEMTRLWPERAAAMGPPPVTWIPDPVARAAPVQPLPLAPAPAGVGDAGGTEEALRRATARLDAARAGLADLAAPGAPGPPARGDVRVSADLRLVLAELSDRHRELLAAVETGRGPALVLAATAFEEETGLPGPRARAVLAEVAAALRSAPGRPVFVQGHTDGLGSETRNQQYSELRAELVRSLLVQEGLDPDRVRALGFGGGRPVATDDSPVGRSLNRRVEIVLVEREVGGGDP
jgi:flagellar motor protein MotB